MGLTLGSWGGKNAAANNTTTGGAGSPSPAASAEKASVWDKLLGGSKSERTAAAALQRAADAYQDEQSALLTASKERERQRAAADYTAKREAESASRKEAAALRRAADAYQDEQNALLTAGKERERRQAAERYAAALAPLNTGLTLGSWGDYVVPESALSAAVQGSSGNAGENAAAGTSRYLDGVYDKADDRTSSLPGSSYADILKRPDYAQYSEAGDSKVRWGFGSDTRYDYINDIDGRREKEDYAMVRGMGDGSLAKYAFMTQDEIGVYNYLYATQGKKAADAFLNELEPELNRQWYSGAKANTEALANENAATKAFYSGLTIAAQPARSLTSILATGQDTLRTITGQGIDPYSELRQLSQMTQDVRGSIAKGMSSVGSFLYNTGMSAGDSAMNMLVSRGLAGAFGLTGDALMKATNLISSAAMSSEAASNSVAESKNKGYSDIGALSLGLIRGGIEYASEAIGGEWVIKNVKKNPLSLLGTMLLGMIPEGVEEVMSDAGNEAVNIAIDLLFNTDESYLANAYQYFDARGDKDPLGSAMRAIAQSELLSFLGGAFATIGSSGVQYGTNRAAINQSAEQLHTTPQTVVTLMQELDTDSPQMIGWLAELHDAENVEDFRQKVGEAKSAEEAIDAAMRAKGRRSAFQEDVTDDELTRLRDLAGQALDTLALDEQTRAQLRERGANNQNAAPDNGSGAVNNTVNGGSTYVENQAQEEQGILGQAQTVPPTGEEAGRGGAPDAAAADPATGTAAAQPIRAEAPGGSGGRYADPSFRGESERVVRSAEERRERAAEQGRRASARQSLGTSLWERGEVNLQSARELGITNGSETQDLKVFPREHYDEEMQDVADWVASEYGLPVTFVSGIIHVADGSGNLYRVRGVYTGNGIVLQADNRNESITSLARHEVFHDEAARDAGLMDAIRAELVEQYSPEEMRQILRDYIINLRGEINVDENTSMEELDEAAMRIFEEVCADAAGGINAFGLGAYQYENTVNRVRQERAALREQANGERETRGPPEDKFSFAGERADGIEVYETSPEVKALRWGERRRRFMDLMENQYRGRTAKFTVDGETYYARFAKEDVKKNIYGDLNSDRPGHDAKINAGADGDIFDLIENTRYDHSEDERGKTSKAHRGIESWDYFVKKVQIDGKVFDLLANVRKSSDAEYVYSLQLNEDKSAEAAPPNRLANDQSLTRALTASTDSITEARENSNTRFSMDDSSTPADRETEVVKNIRSFKAHKKLLEETQNRIWSASSYEKPLLKKRIKELQEICNKEFEWLEEYDDIDEFGITPEDVEEAARTRFVRELSGAIWGDEDETFVNDTEPVKFRWAIVPLESLVVSNDTSGSVNPAYPAELQPRNRGRQASQLQMEKISRNINPRQLEDSPNAQNGAPIIRSDGVVIGGNIRSIALTDAYNKGRADAYRDYLRDRAARKYGLDTAELPEHPVLVRVAEDVSDWAKLARDLNTSTIAAYSATERAMADAARMDSRIMAMLNPDEDGNINSAANKDFIQSFVSNVIPDNERGAAITGNGLLSQDGLERAEYAIFAAAYQDADLMQRMSESLDNDMKNVTNGLLDIAPKVMQHQAAVDAGQMYDTRATENLLAAVRLYTEAKRAGMTVEERTANESLTDDFTDEIIYTARIIEKFKRSAKQIRTFFNGLYDEIESYGDPNQLNFFGEEEDHDYRDALKGAIKRYEQATGTELPTLGDWGAGWYESTAGGNEAETAEPVYAGADPGGGESDGGSPGGEVEEVPWDASPLPPPPTAEPEPTAAPQAEQPEPDETRQRDLERMAKRRKKDRDKQQKKARRQLPKFPFSPEYDPLTQYKDSADPVKEFIKASQARAAAAKAERAMQADKRNFTGTPALQKLGVHIEGSVGNFAHVDQLLARERAAYQLRKMIRRREGVLNATAKEKAFASGMAAGIYTAEDIPANMNRAKLEELADYYWAEKSVASDMIAQRRKDINLGLDAQMDELLKDSDLYKVPPAIVLNYRTPERLCKTIWGDEHGQAIYDAIFRPVSVNEAEKTRFINRMFDEVRTFEGSDGTRSELTKEERMLTQQVLEGRAVQELVASMEMHEAVENAAQNILNGEDTSDAAREFSLADNEKGIAEQYARWLQTKAIYDSGGFDTVKINNAVKKYSEMYDKMYDAINDFLVAHGYDPIGFIKGYAPHMQMNEDLNLFAGYLDRLGFNTNVTRLPTSIAGRTADLKPNKRWNPYFLQRTGDMTDFDIAKGFQSYVNYLSDVLYHTDDIMRVRAMSRYYRRTFAPDEIRETLDWVHYNENASPEVKEEMLKDRGIIARDSKLSPRDIQATFDEWVDKQYESVENMTKYSDYVSYLDNYANILAGKQSSIDRGAEALLGRESLTWGNKLVNSFARTQVAGSFSSALNQTAQLPQIRAELGAKYTAKAATDFMSGAARKGAWAQESDFLTGKRGVDMLVTDAFDMVMEKAFTPATFVDGLMSTLAVRGKYLQQIDAGKSHAEAMKAADEFGRKIMGSRVKGEKPVGFQSKRPVVQMLNLFQIEALNSWEHLSQDLPADFRAIEKQSGTKKAAAALAGVIVKMLLSAFLLNRLGEELYGGTPAPFDIIGLTANFVASGKGLTTNQYLKTVIDNGLEKLTGDRLLGTDPDAAREEFNWGDAFEDTWYNISNDIPFFRNIAGLMGWGDQTLPLPLMGAGQDLKYLFSDLKSDIAEGRLHGQTGMDLLRIINQAMPAGRQLTKTLEGLQLMSQGGRYINDRLYYPVDSDAGTWIKALLFGRSSLNESDAYYAGDNKSLTTAQTEMYRELVRDGADRFEVYQAIQDYKAITSDDDLGNYEKGRRAREAITNADLTDEQRLALFRGMSSNNENRAEDFGEIMETGLTWAETVEAYDKWAELNANEDMTNREKAEAYAAWVDRQDYAEGEEEAVRDHFKFWQSIPITDTKVDKFTDAGMETDTAEQLSETLRNLQPLPGNTQVTDLQKYQAIADSGLSVEDQWTAIIAQTNPSYTSTLAKIEIYRQQGIPPSVWTASKEAMYAADDAGNNNDSTDQSEAKAALDGMNIPTWQKAILWQTTNKSWKANKNPYDREIGQAIYDQMHGGATAGSQAHGGLTLGTWGQYSTSTTPQQDTTPAFTGLSLGSW